jgi:hypothetical protein
MSSLPPSPDQEAQSKGPNLFLLYALLALAILGAMGVAAMIVWPFYKAAKP